MIFTFRANKKQVEDAALKSREKGREEGREEGRIEGRVEGREEGRVEGFSMRDVIWQEWVDQIKDLPKEDWPPQPSPGSGAGNGQNGK